MHLSGSRFECPAARPTQRSRETILVQLAPDNQFDIQNPYQSSSDEASIGASLSSSSSIGASSASSSSAVFLFFSSSSSSSSSSSYSSSLGRFMPCGGFGRLASAAFKPFVSAGLAGM